MGWSNWSAGKKIAVNIMALLVLSIVVGIASIVVVSSLNNRLSDVVNVKARHRSLISELKASALELDAHERELSMMMMLQNTARSEEVRRSLNGFFDVSRQLLRELSSVSEDSASHAYLEKQTAQLDKAYQTHGQILARLDQQKLDMALELLNTSLLPVISDLVSNANQQLQEINNILVEAQTESARLGAMSLYAMVAMLILSVVGGGVAAINLKKMAGSLQQTISDLGENARNLTGMAEQVSSASHSVSQAASEQAASLQETSASAEQIHSMTRRNAEHAQTATKRTREAAATTEDANRALEQMMVSMSEISESSNKISKIIKVIDDIAFQTNILALNAAVEAARAGEAGMGFAVVADEVRNLAQRSAQAAKDTTGLIEESIHCAMEGKEKLDEVARAIATMTENGSAVKALVEEVHGGSDQQAKGIEQIARAVSRMEQVTQQLAATAEESAAAGQDLSGQARAVDGVARSLRNLVGTNSARTATVRKRSIGVPPRKVRLEAKPPLRSNWRSGFQKPEPIELAARRHPGTVLAEDDDFIEQ